MSYSNTENLDTANILKIAIQEVLKEKTELILREEIQNALKNEPIGENNARNGYYSRTLDTMYGKVENLEVPRDRNGDFQTAMFQPYNRRMVAVDELIIQLYQHGVGVRQVGKIMKSLLGDQYSQGTVSNVTCAVMDDVKTWPP
ncbi:transposase [Pseudalkalibacillus sp. R45]|uniref:transposase n=1 Tax=Pseudalkalibacillus sp. R45 TaxID=3457433 RepID=UPI003FCDE43E